VRRKSNVRSAVAVAPVDSGESIFDLGMSILFVLLVAAALFYVLCDDSGLLLAKERTPIAVFFSVLEIFALGIFGAIITGRLPSRSD
jgi:hypothetical protein